MQDSCWISLLKGISWRFLAVLLTFLMSYIVLGNVKTALDISMVDFILKIGVFYIHDRIWYHVPYGLSLSREKLWRSISKGLTYRLIGSSISFVIGFLLTGNIYFASILAFLDIIVKIIAYAIHEQIWQRLINNNDMYKIRINKLL